jgi:hypothetical protein
MGYGYPNSVELYGTANTIMGSMGSKVHSGVSVTFCHIPCDITGISASVDMRNEHVSQLCTYRNIIYHILAMLLFREYSS